MSVDSSSQLDGSYLRVPPERPCEISEHDYSAAEDRPLHSERTRHPAGDNRADRRESDVHEDVGRHHAAPQLVWHDRLEDAISERAVDQHRQAEKEQHYRSQRNDPDKRKKNRQHRERERSITEQAASLDSRPQRGEGQST